MSRAVTIIKHMFGQRIVDGNDREGQFTVGFHSLKTNNACGGLFRTPQQMRNQFAAAAQYGIHQIRPVIHRDMWLSI